MLDNCSLETEQVKTIRDDLNYYLDENQVIRVRLCQCGRRSALDGRTCGRGHGTGGPVGVVVHGTGESVGVGVVVHGTGGSVGGVVHGTGGSVGVVVHGTGGSVGGASIGESPCYRHLHHYIQVLHGQSTPTNP